MSRIFYDTMLFIYLLEDIPQYVTRVNRLLARSRGRGDELFTSHFAVGEVLAGTHLPGASTVAASIRESLKEMTFNCSLSMRGQSILLASSEDFTKSRSPIRSILLAPPQQG